jgi:hypothetical protein
MKLAQLQQAFQAHVLQGAREIELAVQGDARVSTALRLGVYAEAYASRLVEVLAETFPAVQVALGTNRFARLIGEFARAHPSQVRSARDYGAHLSHWLAARLTGPHARGIADLARFEWMIAAAFDAADQNALKAESLATLAPAHWPQLQFGFSPTVRRLSVTSNCVAWWKFASAQQARPSRWRATCEQQWLVWRRELAVFYRRLSQREARALDAALTGQSFGQLCEQLGDPARAASLLHGWFSEGLVTAASVGPRGD